MALLAHAEDALVARIVLGELDERIAHADVIVLVRAHEAGKLNGAGQPALVGERRGLGAQHDGVLLADAHPLARGDGQTLALDVQHSQTVLRASHFAAQEVRLADEVGELLLVYLAEALEPSDDGVVAQASAGGLALLVGIAVDGAASVEVLKAAANHKGASVVEVLQNCVIFNDGTHASVATKEGRAKNAIYLEHGKPMLFGENKEFGLMQEGFGLKVVKLGENGITEKDILIHDAHCQDNTLQLKLALMEGPDFPIALGVIRDVDAPTYNDAVTEQIEEIKGKKKYHNFQELLMTNDTWEVK